MIASIRLISPLRYSRSDASPQVSTPSMRQTICVRSSSTIFAESDRSTASMASEKPSSCAVAFDFGVAGLSCFGGGAGAGLGDAGLGAAGVARASSTASRGLGGGGSSGPPTVRITTVASPKTKASSRPLSRTVSPIGGWLQQKGPTQPPSRSSADTPLEKAQPPPS